MARGIERIDTYKGIDIYRDPYMKGHIFKHGKNGARNNMKMGMRYETDLYRKGMITEQITYCIVGKGYRLKKAQKRIDDIIDVVLHRMKNGVYTKIY